jgi:integrase
VARQAKQVSGVYEKTEGSGIWYIRYRTQGKLVRKKVGTQKQAKDYLDKLRLVRATGDGIVPVTATQPVRTVKEAAELAVVQGSILISKLCDGLLKQIQERPREYMDQLNPPYRIGVIRKAFGERPAASIKVSEISDWFRALPAAPATQNRYRAVFSSIYNYGVQRDLIQNNPVRATEPVPVDNGVIRFLLLSEEARIRTVLQEDIDACGSRNEQLRKHMIHRKCEFDVALFSGMRKGEQYDLLWDDVNYEIKECTARDTKNGTSRQVHLTQTVVKALRTVEDLSLERKRRREETPNPSRRNVVFALRDNKNWWGKVMRRAKVRHFRWHDLRHTFCSRLAQRGVSLKVIQELAGHKTIQMSARYAHLDKTSVLEGLAVLEQDDDASSPVTDRKRATPQRSPGSDREV